MNYTQLNEKLTGRNKERRKMGNNTYAERRGDDIAIRLHATDIMTFHPDGRIVLNSGGWKTPTTKARINEFLPRGIHLWQERGVWKWSNGRPFTDGDYVTPEGEVQAQAEDDKVQQKLRKQIREYSKLYSENLPMQPPGPGDCWFCSMVTEGGQSLGEATKNTEHFLLHMKEGYVVPSLAMRAMRSAGFGDGLIAGAFQKDAPFFTGVTKDRLPKAVARYLYLQFGLAR